MLNLEELKQKVIKLYPRFLWLRGKLPTGLEREEFEKDFFVNVKMLFGDGTYLYRIRLKHESALRRKERSEK